MSDRRAHRYVPAVVMTVMAAVPLVTSAEILAHMGTSPSVVQPIPAARSKNWVHWLRVVSVPDSDANGPSHADCPADACPPVDTDTPADTSPAVDSRTPVDTGPAVYTNGSIHDASADFVRSHPRKRNVSGWDLSGHVRKFERQHHRPRRADCWSVDIGPNGQPSILLHKFDSCAHA